jgi:GTP cyclohydrolase I
VPCARTKKSRGVRSHDARMTTFARRGVYAADESRGMQAVQLVRDMARDMARRG